MRQREIAYSSRHGRDMSAGYRNKKDGGKNVLQKNILSYHSHYPSPDEILLDHLIPLPPPSSVSTDERADEHVKHRHSVLHDSLLSGDKKLASRVSDLTVRIVQSFCTLRRNLTDKDEGVGPGSVPSIPLGDGTAFNLTGYYGTYQLGLFFNPLLCNLGV